MGDHGRPIGEINIKYIAERPIGDTYINDSWMTPASAMQTFGRPMGDPDGLAIYMPTRDHGQPMDYPWVPMDDPWVTNKWATHGSVM